MAVLHDKQEGTFDPLTSKDLIFDLGEREGLYRAVVTPYCLGSSFPLEPFVEDAVTSNNLVSLNTIFAIAQYYSGYYVVLYVQWNVINPTLAAASALLPDFATCE